jgi:microcystin degradation protein MlrC
MKIGVALIQQETNTFSLQRTGIDEFAIRRGGSAEHHTRDTNSEMAGAIETIVTAGHDAVPLLYAWALPSGRVTADAFGRLQTMLADGVASATGLDGLVLALHGSMAAETVDDADAVLIETARAALSTGPIGVSLDLHANVTRRMVGAADAIVGYHTDPHVDMDTTGGRAAGQVLSILAGSLEPAISLAKRPMIVPAESMNTTSGPLSSTRRRADREGAVDISLFPAQPWLDVPELGFGVVVTTNGDQLRAERGPSSSRSPRMPRRRGLRATARRCSRRSSETATV